MKKIVIFVLFVLTASFSICQTVNNTPILELNVDYVQIVGTFKNFSSKLTICVDFGQKSNFLGYSSKTHTVKDENGKDVSFNSMIDALNFMSKNGFEYCDSYILDSGGKHEQIYYILKKKKKTNKKK